MAQSETKDINTVVIAATTPPPPTGTYSIGRGAAGIYRDPSSTSEPRPLRRPEYRGPVRVRKDI